MQPFQAPGQLPERLGVDSEAWPGRARVYTCRVSITEQRGFTRRPATRCVRFSAYTESRVF